MTSKHTEPPGNGAGPIATPRAATQSAAMQKALRLLAGQNIQPCAPWQLAQLMLKLELQKKTNKLSQSGVQPGCSVLLLEMENQQSSWIKLASPEAPEQTEAGLVSLLSPLGIALLGKQSGDLIVLQLFGRPLHFQLLDIIRVKHKPGSTTNKTAP